MVNISKDTLIFSGLGIVAIAAIIFGVRSNMGSSSFDSTPQYNQSQSAYIQPETSYQESPYSDDQRYNQQNQNPYQQDMQAYGGGKRKQSKKLRKSKKRKSKRIKK